MPAKTACHVMLFTCSSSSFKATSSHLQDLFLAVLVLPARLLLRGLHAEVTEKRRRLPG